MRILLTGAGGQLGLELKKLLPREGHEISAFTHGELDVSDAKTLRRALADHGPDLVINAAAYTDVEGCEENPHLAYTSNALGPRNLALFCERVGCELLHVSTNYVFDGRSERAYEHSDIPHPINAYGRTKLSGEDYVGRFCSRWYVVRSAGVYGEGHNFVRTMLKVGPEKGRLKVKDDEYVNPTYARDLAHGIAEIVSSGIYGVYHVANAGSCSWYEFARGIFDLAGLDVEVEPVPSSEYPMPAARPANGVLSSTGGTELRHWQQALTEYLKRG
jgi:dTDP-4-dehydrorhamnose reductase